MGAVTYTWSNGATGETMTLAQSDVGSTITVTASYTDAQGTAETMASAATAAVANVNDSPTGTVSIAGTATEDQVLTASNDLADEMVLEQSHTHGAMVTPVRLQHWVNLMLGTQSL